jgi:nucleotide-binding universal stress UspA family protein
MPAKEAAMNVLIAVDDSAEARHAVDVAYRFFGPDADYSILSVGDRPPVFAGGYGAGAMPTAADLTQQLDAAHAVAEDAVTHAAELLPDAETEVEDGKPGSIICEFAEEHESDVIVIGSHDRSFWLRLFDPSVGRHVLDNAPCPVLVVR